MNLQDKVKNFLQNAGQVVNNFSHGAQQAVGNEAQQLPQQVSTFGSNLLSGLRSQAFQIPQVQQLNQAGAFYNSPQVQNFGNQIAQNPFIKPILNQPLPVPLLQGNVPRPTIGQFAQGQIIKPALTAMNPNASLFSRATAAAQTGFNIFNPVEAAAYNVGTGGLAGALKTATQGGNLNQNIAQGMANPSDIAGTGLGIKNPVLATGIDLLAGNPEAVAGKAKGIVQGLKGYSPNGFNIHPDDQKVMSDFVNAVQSGSGKGDLGQLGKDAQVLADHYIGASAKDISNQKLAQAFDALLSSAAKNRGEDVLQTPFPKMGIVGDNNLKEQNSNSSPFYKGPTVGVTDQELSKYIKDISKDPQYNNYLKINNGDENRAVARVLEDRLSNGKVPKDIMQSIYSKTPTVQDMETGELLSSMDSFRGEHARRLMDNLGVDLSNIAQPKLKEQILTQPPEPARMSQKALDKGLLDPKIGSDISVSPQAEQRFKLTGGAQPNPAEQASITDFEKNVLGGKVANFNPEMGVQTENPNLKVKAPPENPNGGIAAVNPKDVAAQARLASFGARQSLEVRGGNLAQEMDSVLKNPKDNLNIRLALENPSKIDEYASRAQDPEAFATLAHKISDFYDYALGASKGQKIPMGTVQSYFTHVWDLSTPEAQQIFNDLMAANAKNFTSGFTKERVVNTIQEGLAKGLDLKNAKASNDILAYTKSMGKQVSSAAFNNKINELRPGGAVPFSANGTVPFNYEGKLFQQSNKPGNAGTFIDPEIQKYMTYYNKSALADNPVVNVADKINTGIKEMKLAGGLFHGLRESVNYAGQQLMSGHIPDLPGGAMAFLDPSFARSQMNNFISKGTLDAASKMGIDISSAGGIGNETTNFMDLMRSKDAIKTATFSRLIPYYIMKTVDNLPESSRTPEVGRQIMALYNGLTSEVAGTNKTASQLARFTFLAPQFNLGKIINVVSAFKPENTPQANFARQALVGTAIATAIEYEIANYVANQKIDMDPKSILSNGILHPNISLPYKSPTGKALAADLPASNLADLYKTGAGGLAKAGIDLFTGKGDQVGNDLSQAGTDASHALTSRTSSLFSLANQVQSGKDYYGNPVNMSNLAQSQLPIPIVQGLKTVQNNPKTGQPSQDIRTALLNTAGLRVHNDQNDPTVQAQTKYFDDIKKYSQTLNPNEQGMFNSVLHPTSKDANGNSIVDKNVYTTPDKYETLLAHPNLLATEQKFQQAQKSHDPMWDLNSQQLRAFMQANVISKNNPTSGFKTGDTTVKTLYSTLPQSFFTQRQQWMQSLPASTTASQGPQAPQMPPEVSQFWNSYSSLPYGTGARTKALQSSVGQEALAFINQQQTYTNQQRADMGLPLLASTTGSTSGGSGGGSSARISAQRRTSNASARRMFKVGSGSNKIPFAKFGGMKAPRIKGISAKAISLSTSKKTKKLARNGKPLTLKS